MNHMARRNTFSPDMGQARQELPSNIEAEQALLGALLVNNAAMNAIMPTGIGYQHFHEPFHRVVFEAIRECIKAGKVANPVTIRSFAPPDLMARAIGDMTAAQYVARLCSEAISVINAPDYAQAVISCAMRRDGLGAMETVEVACRSAEDDFALADSLRDCRDRLTNILAVLEGKDDDDTSFLDDIDNTLNITDEAARGIELPGIDPILHELRALTGPWQKGQLIIIGGDVKQGKSALAWQTFFEIAAKHPVAGNSGEMPRSQIIMREKARRTGISARQQKMGRVSEIEMQELVRAGADMKKLKHIDIDCRRLTLEQIDAKIDRLRGEYGIEAFFIDHILKLQWTGKMEDADDFKKANRATSTLKDMAMKHDIPIVALTHLNKTGFQEPFGKTYRDRLKSALRRRPTYKSLLGNIDKDADNVIITYQAKPVIAAMEPEQGTDDYNAWEDAMESVQGKAELILALSRENEFPRRKEVEWHGSTTSYGPPFKQAFNERRTLL